MNMLIRFFIMMALLKAQLKQQSTTSLLTEEQLFKPVARSYRILPHDMGFRNHLPNYRYLSFIELNVTKWLLQMTHQKGLKDLMWILSMQEMVYLKEIKFLDKITLKSTLEGWDEKYVYFQHHFFVKNTLMAIGMSKFILVNKTGKQTPDILNMQGSHMSSVIESWNEHQTAIKSQ